MNTIFFDLNNNSTGKFNNLKNKFKYFVKDDMLNNVLSKNTYITIDKEYINGQLKKNKYSIHDRMFKFCIKRRYSKNDEVNLIFSKQFDDCLNIKNYILNLLRLNSITIYNEVSVLNKLKQNDTIYIDNYVKNTKKDLNKLKLLVVLDSIKDYDENKILEYISKYKFVDILRTNNINKYDYKKILTNVRKINAEYGTTIDIIQKRNIQKYDVYLLYSNLKKIEFSQKYILSSNSLYINMQDIDSDVLSEEYVRYIRFEPEILTLLNRLGINSENFSKLKLSFLFK